MGNRKEKAESGRKQKAKMRKDSPNLIPNKAASVALKSANKGKVHRTTIKGKEAKPFYKKPTPSRAVVRCLARR